MSIQPPGLPSMSLSDIASPRVTPRAAGRCPRCGHTFEDCTCGRSHRDDPARTRPPRPGRARRVTQDALIQARSTLATAERQIIRARGNRRWRLVMAIDSARAVLRAAGGATA